MLLKNKETGEIVTKPMGISVDKTLKDYYKSKELARSLAPEVTSPENMSAVVHGLDLIKGFRSRRR